MQMLGNYLGPCCAKLLELKVKLNLFLKPANPWHAYEAHMLTDTLTHITVMPLFVC